MLTVRATTAPETHHSGTPMTRINTQFSRARLLVISGLLATSFAYGNDDSDELQVGRYQTVILQPTDEQLDLLSSIVEIELPGDIKTVGQAIVHLLDGSGYRLLSPKLAEPYRVLLFSLPLPKVQRQLGPISLRQALEMLSGPAFRLVIEPAYRLVSFELVSASTTSDTDADS